MIEAAGFHVVQAVGGICSTAAKVEQDAVVIEGIVRLVDEGVEFDGLISDLEAKPFESPESSARSCPACRCRCSCSG